MTIQDIQNIQISDYDYPLPDHRIARHPLPVRDACKLLAASPGAPLLHTSFSNLPDLLPPDTLLIANETRVINARLAFHRPSGGRIETFLLEPDDPSDYVLSFAQNRSCTWKCMIGNLKKWKEPTLSRTIPLPPQTGLTGRTPESGSLFSAQGACDFSDTSATLSATLLPLLPDEAPSATRRVKFEWDNPSLSFASIVEAAGNIPIPPYLKRESETSDLTDYQTVYSRVDGSVAAPTAGLHFTPQLFNRLAQKGVTLKKVTLHVGAGTFQPVKSEHIGAHPMHTETVCVDLDTIRAVADALEQHRPIVAVGTTSVRTLESLPWFALLASRQFPTEKPQGASNGKPQEASRENPLHVTQWMAYTEELPADTPALLRSLADSLEARGLPALTGSTAIMIAPGFTWRIVSGMVTNFHQPQSTLLLLVSSFLESFGHIAPDNHACGETAPTTPLWRRIYSEALDNGYRFLSYGDACLFLNQACSV